MTIEVTGFKSREENMKNRISVVFLFVLFLSTLLSANIYKTGHFNIYSDLHPEYVKCIQANSEAYYKNLLKRKYFDSGWEDRPLKIYLCRKQSQARKMLKAREYENLDQYYDPNAPAIYAFCINDKDEHIGWNMLFEQIIHHFMHINSQKGPDWFKEELATFFTTCTAIVDDEIRFTAPPPQGQMQLIENFNTEGIGDSVKKLYLRSSRQYEQWTIARPFTQTFFYWLCQENYFEEYIQQIHEQEYKIGVLEEVIDERYGDIKLMLSDFMEEHCTAAARLEKALETTNLKEKEKVLIEALQSSPHYKRILFELAKCRYHRGDHEKCLEDLDEILSQPECYEYRNAARLAGDAYYDQENYNRAIEHYLLAWNKSGFYERKYRVPYRIANCYYYLDDTAKACQWYQVFLEKKWCKDEMLACSNYAKKYIDKNLLVN